MTDEERDWWRGRLRRLGGWIHRNRVVGTFVVNCAVELCHALWRVGGEVGEAERQAWALSALHERIDRDVDAEGWIHGENDGCSGAYQLVGLECHDAFAVRSGDAIVTDAFRRGIATVLRFAAPDLRFPGNLGTRSTTLRRISGEALLRAAAVGVGAAATAVRERSDIAWSEDVDLWCRALATPPAVDGVENVHTFPGVSGHVLGAGPWFGDYDKSLWARGFTNLWHDRLGLVFSTLHSLPAEVEEAKLRLGDTSDWAGFPHVRVLHDGIAYDSHQRIASLYLGDDGIAWSEPLLSRAGERNGTRTRRSRRAAMPSRSTSSSATPRRRDLRLPRPPPGG